MQEAAADEEKLKVDVKSNNQTVKGLEENTRCSQNSQQNKSY